MTLKECLNYICERQIPKEINGIRTKYIIEEYKNYFSTPCMALTILPTECRADNIGVTVKWESSFYFDYDYTEGSIGFRECRRMIEEALCEYINNVITYFNGEVVESHHYNVVLKGVNKDGD